MFVLVTSPRVCVASVVVVDKSGHVCVTDSWQEQGGGGGGGYGVRSEVLNKVVYTRRHLNTHTCMYTQYYAHVCNQYSRCVLVYIMYIFDTANCGKNTQFSLAVFGLFTGRYMCLSLSRGTFPRILFTCSYCP